MKWLKVCALYLLLISVFWNSAFGISQALKLGFFGRNIDARIRLLDIAVTDLAGKLSAEVTSCEVFILDTNARKRSTYESLILKSRLRPLKTSIVDSMYSIKRAKNEAVVIFYRQGSREVTLANNIVDYMAFHGHSPPRTIMDQTFGFIGLIFIL